MGDLERRQLNAARLQKVHKGLHRKIEAIIDDMEGHGYRPIIDKNVWRSPAEQAAIKRAGRSKVSYSFHNVTTKDGKPDALACDIVDVNYQWNAPKHYWLKLAASAEAHGMETGIYWGLGLINRARLRKAIKERNWAYNGPLGWDAAHLQPKGISILAARLGKRP